MHIPILYQDDDIVVVDKPIGVPTHATDPDDPYPGDALRVTQAQLGLPYLGMHQRLDAETSGVLLFSARPEANPALAAAFEGHAVRKVYLALIHGAHAKSAGVIDAPIVRDHDGRYRVTTTDDRRGQTAGTRYRVLERGATYSLLEITPETGRSHQIRVHLAHVGVPVLGDPLYGPEPVGAPRLCLHASRLDLPHPITGERVTFTAPTPAIFDAVRPRRRRNSRWRWRWPHRVHTCAPWRTRPTACATLLGLAVARRAPLADPETTIYRLVNGAADGLPGLTVDRYGDALVVSLYDADDRLPPDPIPPVLLDTLAEATGLASIYVKYRPRQASRLSEEQLALLAPTEPVAGPDLGEFVAHEDGLAYVIRPGDGLSAGLFPDMREGRGRVRAWVVRPARAQLLCLHLRLRRRGHGGRRDARAESRPVEDRCAWGQANYRANGFEPDPHDFVYGDVFDWLDGWRGAATVSTW